MGSAEISENETSSARAQGFGIDGVESSKADENVESSTALMMINPSEGEADWVTHKKEDIAEGGEMLAELEILERTAFGRQGLVR